MELLELPLPALEGLMQLDDVDVVGIQTAQGVFQRGARIVPRADLGGDGDALPLGLEHPAQQPLRRAFAVRRCRIEEGDTTLDRVADRCGTLAFLFRRAPAAAADRPGSEPQSRCDVQETRKGPDIRSEEHTSELQSQSNLV